MARFLGAGVIAAMLLGSVGVCQFLMARQLEFSLTRDVDEHGGGHETTTAEREYVLELTPTFEARADPFALRPATGGDAARLRVRRGDRELLRVTEDVRRGEPIRSEMVRFDTANRVVRLYVEGTPSTDEARRACALRIRMLTADDVLCGEATLWSEGNGQTVSGEVALALDPKLESVDRGLAEE